jgi:hypothetical protein
MTPTIALPETAANAAGHKRVAPRCIIPVLHETRAQPINPVGVHSSTKVQWGKGEMSTTDIIIAVVFGVMSVGFIIGSCHRHRQVFSALFVVGIVGLAIVLTIVRGTESTGGSTPPQVQTPHAGDP